MRFGGDEDTIDFSELRSPDGDVLTLSDRSSGSIDAQIEDMTLSELIKGISSAERIRGI